MLNFPAMVSGDQIGAELANDGEECAIALHALAESAKGSDREEIMDYLSQLPRDQRALVRQLAKEIMEACA